MIAMALLLPIPAQAMGKPIVIAEASSHNPSGARHKIGVGI